MGASLTEVGLHNTVRIARASKCLDHHFHNDFPAGGLLEASQEVEVGISPLRRQVNGVFGWHGIHCVKKLVTQYRKKALASLANALGTVCIGLGAVESPVGRFHGGAFLTIATSMRD